MKRSPLIATIVVAFFLIGTPIALISRLTDGLFPTQAYDIVLAVAVVAWVLVCKAILDRDDPMDTLVENRLSPSWQAASLVEQSLFGVGFTSNKAAHNPVADPKLHRLQSADTPHDSLMPPVVADPYSGRADSDLGEGNRPRLQPTLRQAEDAVPPILATEEYVAVRGDTFWSIAEQRLGDGRRWKQVEELNVGRQVTETVVCSEGNGVRIGWTLLVPIPEVAAESVA